MQASRVSISAAAGSSIFDMNNFVGATRYRAAAGARYATSDHVSVGLGIETAKVDLRRFGYAGRGALDSRRVTANARYTFGKPSDRVRPFVQAGVGVARVAARFAVDPGAYAPNLVRTRGTDRAPSFEGVAGATVRLAPGVHLEAQGGYQMTDNLRYPIYIKEPGRAERSNYQNGDGKLLRTTGFERHYTAQIGLVVTFDAIRSFFGGR